MKRYLVIATLPIILASTLCTAETIYTRNGVVDIQYDLDNIEGQIYLDGKLIQKLEADFLVPQGIFELGSRDIIPISEQTATGRTPNFQYILVVKPDHTTMLYEHPEPSRKATFNVTDKFVATYDDELITYDGHEFKSQPYNADLFRPIHYLPLELCEGLYDNRDTIVDMYQKHSRLDPNDFPQFARGWIDELVNYPFFSVEKMMHLGGKHDQHLKHVSLEDFKNAVCVDDIL